MSHIEILTDLELNSPVLIEGLPGVGLVGKLATDHVVDELEMTYAGHLTCPGLPQVTVYEEGNHTLRPPVRIYADEDRDLLALQSDVPVSPSSVSDFASCLTGWLSQHDVLPLYFSGLPMKVDKQRSLYGVTTGDESLLDEHDVEPPGDDGVWSGPTGALLSRAGETGQDALGFIVEADSNFPDPKSACALISRVINPIAGVDVDDAELRDHAQEIRQEKAQFAQHMNQTEDDDSSRAETFEMFQ
jgi:uncharacterized protein